MNEPGWLYLVIATVGLTVTVFATRSGFYLLATRVALPPLVERILRYAPACALAAIVVPGVLVKGGDPHLSVHNHEMWAALAAGAVFLKWRNMLAMITVGLLVFTALRLWA